MFKNKKLLLAGIASALCISQAQCGVTHKSNDMHDKMHHKMSEKDAKDKAKEIENRMGKTKNMLKRLEKMSERGKTSKDMLDISHKLMGLRQRVEKMTHHKITHLQEATLNKEIHDKLMHMAMQAKNKKGPADRKTTTLANKLHSSAEKMLMHK